MKIDKKIIQELSDYLKEFNLTEIEITDKDTKIKVSKNNISVSNQPQVVSPSQVVTGSTSTPTQKVLSGTEITSPIIGTAYHSPEPGAKKFVELGQKVKIGQVLLIIEAMKTMNEITADKNGVVKKIFIRNEAPVEFGEPLILIE